MKHSKQFPDTAARNTLSAVKQLDELTQKNFPNSQKIHPQNAAHSNAASRHHSNYGPSNLTILAKVIVVAILVILLFGGIYFFHTLKSTRKESTFTGKTLNSIELLNSQDHFSTNFIFTSSSSLVNPADSLNKISLQAQINDWLNHTPGSIGLMVYDLDQNQILAEYRAQDEFSTASLYKLFYAYDGYRQIDQQLRDPDLILAGDHTYRQCLDAIIRESDNLCAENLFEQPSNITRVMSLISELQLTHTTGAVLTTSAADMTKLLIHLYRHSDLSDTSWRALQDSMLHQSRPDLRQGLPNGFKIAAVYAKVGFSDSTYNDVALINYPAKNRNFSVVVLTENLPTHQYLTQLGEILENYFLQTL